MTGVARATAALPAALELRGLALGHGRGRRARGLLAGADAALRAGELCCLAGPNGSGKTTLIRALAGLDPPRGGDILLGGQPLAAMPDAARARRLALVLTEAVDPGYMTALEVAMLGRIPFRGFLGARGGPDGAIAMEALGRAGVAALAGRDFGTLSDGEKQRVLVARCIAQDGEVLLLDEASSHLDLGHRLEIVAALRGLAAERDKAILFSTHDLETAFGLADSVWLLDGTGSLLALPVEEMLGREELERAFCSSTLAKKGFRDMLERIRIYRSESTEKT